MSASVTNDKITQTMNGGNPVATTVSSNRSIGGTSLSVVGTTNWPTTTAVYFITYKKNTDGSMNTATLCSWKAVVSGTTLGSLTLENGTDAGNDAGDYVEMAPTAAWGEGIYEWAVTSHNTDGTLKDGAISSLSMLTTALANILTPTGGVMLYGGSTAPTSWLLCDGTAYSRTTYAALFTAIGTSYGIGDGSTTFNVPNFKGKVAVGLDASDTDFDTLGKNIGTKTVALTIAQMPSHAHTTSTTGNTNPKSTYGGSTGTSGVDLVNVASNSMGQDQPHNNIQPSLVVNYIIKF